MSHPLHNNDQARNRLILDADTQAPDAGKPKDLPRLYQATLESVFDFTQSELNQNRMGRISPAQQARLADDFKEEVDGFSFLITLFLAVSVLLAIIFTSQGLPMEYLLVGAGILLAWLAFYSLRRQGRKRTDALNTKRIASVTGIPHFQLKGVMSGANERVRWVVKDQELTLTMAQAQALMGYEMPLLKVYYTAESRAIVSAEVLDYPDDKPKRDDDLFIMDDDADEKAKRG
jgi:hypothetical protein